MIPAQLTPVRGEVRDCKHVRHPRHESTNQHPLRMLTDYSASRGLTDEQICDEGENGNQRGNAGLGLMTTVRSSATMIAVNKPPVMK
jgi:hypothetical protein